MVVKSWHGIMSDEVDYPISGATFVPLTAEDKKRNYQKWSKAIIVKVYGKTVSYRLLCRKLNELWNPIESLQIMDLGIDFFMINSQKHENYTTTLHKGPWFVSGQFLPIHQWQPHFKPTDAKFNFTAI